MIVKVQLSIDSNPTGHTPGSWMLVYNKSRSVLYHSPAEGEVVEKLKNRPKAFFNAEPKKDPKFSGEVVILEEAAWQDW